MENQDKQIFSWIVKKGSIILSGGNDKINLEINKEGNPACLLTRTDAKEIISILTEISQNIWNSPGYTKEPYLGKIFKLNDQGKAYWEINETILYIGINDEEEALELDFEGNPVLILPVNVSIEIIQIMEHFLNEL